MEKDQGDRRSMQREKSGQRGIVDPKKEEYFMKEWSTVEGLVRTESTGDLDKNSFREMEGTEAKQQ